MVTNRDYFAENCVKRYYVGTAVVIFLAIASIVAKWFDWINIVTFNGGVMLTVILAGVVIGFLMQISALIDLRNHSYNLNQEFQSVLHSYNTTNQRKQKRLSFDAFESHSDNGPPTIH